MGGNDACSWIQVQTFRGLGGHGSPTQTSLIAGSIRWGQRVGPSAAKEARGKASTLATVGSKVDAGGFEPPAFWLQTRRSSN